jgi:hypothetical protein
MDGRKASFAPEDLCVELGPPADSKWAFEMQAIIGGLVMYVAVNEPVTMSNCIDFGQRSADPLGFA